MKTLLELQSITKRFPGVRALRGVSFDVKVGEIHALLGENGAGKSTLMKILSGVHTPDEGCILLEGKTIHFKSPREAHKSGIVAVHQHSDLVPNLSISENLFLGREIHGFGFLNWTAMHSEAHQLLKQVGLNLDPRRSLSTLGMGEQLLVALAKAIHADARMVIMDEPSAALNATEVQKLFQVVQELKASGVSIIYISHHLEEIMSLADRVTVMRDGQSVGTVEVKATTLDALVHMMVGHTLQSHYPRRDHKAGDPLLKVEDLTRKDGRIRGISFTLHKGEILGIGGLMGSGRTELLQALFGLQPVLSGSIALNNQPLTVRSPHDAVQAGMVLLSDDRKRHGLIRNLSVKENITLGILNQLSPMEIIDFQSEAAMAEKYIDELGIRTRGQQHNVDHLSGGNQQKVLLSRCMALNPKVLLVDEPTRGVDIGAKMEIYRILHHLTDQGMGVILVTSDLSELLDVSTRIMVLHQGKAVGTLQEAPFDQDVFMRMATCQDVVQWSD